jgi:hypothetical protein
MYCWRGGRRFRRAAFTPPVRKDKFVCDVWVKHAHVEVPNVLL